MAWRTRARHNDGMSTPIVKPLTGSFTGTGQSATFRPFPAKYPHAGFNVTLRGTFVATVRLERSFDDGVTWDPLTAAGTPMFVFTGPASEIQEEPEEGVLYRLNCTAYTSGTVDYRLSQ
jgi:hypothetical protein